MNGKSDAERLTPTSTPGIYAYHDHMGRQWGVIFDPVIADAGGGKVVFSVWGHPVFSRLQGNST